MRFSRQKYRLLSEKRRKIIIYKDKRLPNRTVREKEINGSPCCIEENLAGENVDEGGVPNIIYS